MSGPPWGIEKLHAAGNNWHADPLDVYFRPELAIETSCMSHSQKVLENTLGRDKEIVKQLAPQIGKSSCSAPRPQRPRA